MAWARLSVDDAAAADVANRAVAIAASHRKRVRGSALKIAARHEAARLLARGVAAAPSEDAEHRHGTSLHAPTARAKSTGNTYAPAAPGHQPGQGTSPPDPREQTAMGRLEMALETLEPYQRLACVSYFLDAISTDAIASLLGVSRERAIHILEGAAPTIARAVGDHEVPDFSAATDEVEVVTL